MENDLENEIILNQRRKKIKKNQYPEKTSRREINSIMRDCYGNMIIPYVSGDTVVFHLTDVKDIPELKTIINGTRPFRPFYFKYLKDRVIDYDFKGEKFMYCLHEVEQKLRPISDFTTNKIIRSTIFKIDSFGQALSLQSKCRETTKLYTNNGTAGNQTRTKSQHLEDTGSRTRTSIIKLVFPRPKIKYHLIFNKFEGKCFCCGDSIQFDKKVGKKSNLDHTLPHSFYYPYTNEDATLLCSDCNQSKKNKWPSEFYTIEKLEELSKIVDIPFETLSGQKRYNSDIFVKFDNEFNDFMVKLEYSFKRRLDKNKIKVFKLIIRDMDRFGKIQPEFLELSNSLTIKLVEYIKEKYNE